MKVIGRVLLLIILVPLVFPLGAIAIVLNPFIELFLKEEKDDNSK